MPHQHPPGRLTTWLARTLDRFAPSRPAAGLPSPLRGGVRGGGNPYGGSESHTAPATKSLTGPYFAFDRLAQPAWAPRDYAAFAREGFMQNAILYRAVRMIAEAAASVPLLLYQGDDEIAGHPLLDLIARPNGFPSATVRRIYRERYWLQASCPLLTAPLAFFHFDAAVNQGVTGAARLLQEAVGADIDGEIGPETLGKSTARPMPETLALYAEARRRHYRSLSTFWRFGRGWLARVDRTLQAARAIAAATGSPPHRAGGASSTRRGEGLGVGGTPTADVSQSTSPSQPKEQAPMTDTTTATTRAPSTPDIADSKWWGQSMTIWGVIITTLSTVLPAFGPLLGLDITAELIRQLGDQIVVVVQAVGGLIGTILTIWGRARATTSLERKTLTMNL